MDAIDIFLTPCDFSVWVIAKEVEMRLAYALFYYVVKTHKKIKKELTYVLKLQNLNDLKLIIRASFNINENKP